MLPWLLLPVEEESHQECVMRLLVAQASSLGEIPSPESVDLAFVACNEIHEVVK